MTLYKAVIRDSVGESTDYTYQDFPYSSSNKENEHNDALSQQVGLEVVEHLKRVGQYLGNNSAEHNRRVGDLSAKLALHLAMPAHYATLIYQAAQLHDLGKIAIPDSILSKPAQLTDKEYQLVQRHCQIGADLLAGSDSEVLRMAQSIALTHHERWDGSGYPFRLLTTTIPLEARIVAVADVFDALLHERPYKQAWPLENIVMHFIERKGIHFDPLIVDTLFEILRSRTYGVLPNDLFSTTLYSDFQSVN